MSDKLFTINVKAERVVVLPVTKERRKINVSDFTDEILVKLVQYGLQQKITDSATISKEAEPDEVKRKALRLEKVNDCIKNLKAGKWGATRMDPFDKAILSVATKHAPSISKASAEQKAEIVAKLKEEKTETSKRIMDLVREKMETDRKVSTSTSASSLLDDIGLGTDESDEKRGGIMTQDNATLDARGLDILFRKAHSHTRWSDRPLDDAILHQIYDCAKFGPTSANCCPMRIAFIRGVEAKQKLRDCLSPGNVDKTMAAPVTAIFAYDRQFYTQMKRLSPYSNIGSGYADDRARADRDGHFNATLQCAYTILSARAFGVDCGPMLGFNKEKTDRAFFAGTDWRSVLLCNLGYGMDTERKRAPRLTFAEACRVE